MDEITWQQSLPVIGLQVASSFEMSLGSLSWNLLWKGGKKCMDHAPEEHLNNPATMLYSGFVDQPLSELF